MAWAAAAGAAIGAGASIAGEWYRARQAGRSVNRQLQFQRDAMDRSWKRSQTAYRKRYQWQMADMRAAGLNPILSYNQTPPQMASPPVPGGASYQPGNLMSGVPEAVNSAVGAYRAKKEGEQREQAVSESKSTEKLQDEKAQTEKTVQQLNWAKTQRENAEAVYRSVETLRSHSARKLLESQDVIAKIEQIIGEERAKVAKARGSAAGHEQEIWDSTLGRVLKWLDVTGRALNPSATAAKGLRGR